MGAHAPPDVVVVAFGKQMPIEFAHPLMAEGPGIVLFVLDAAAQHPQPIAAAGIAGQISFKNPGMVRVLHRLAGVRQQQLHPIRIRHPDPDHPATAFDRLGPQE